MRSGTGGGGAFASLCTAVPSAQKKKRRERAISLPGSLSYPSLSPRRDVLERTLGTRLGKGFGLRFGQRLERFSLDCRK